VTVPDGPSIAYERAPLGDFTETELVLLQALLRSGLKVRAHTVDDVAFATALNARLTQAVSGELRARRVTEQDIANRLVDRACTRLLAEAKRG